ncbi:MAG: hypothetical protein LBU34_01695 [Planctomycetaceae bacterium]|jgi:hypothetical protein|nr:hypothetical protein [Planctomycetaceae bacterium]
MSTTPREPHFYSQIDVVHSLPQSKPEPQSEVCSLLRELLAAQSRQNELLEELVLQISQPHHRKAMELALWKRSNPELADFCRRAAVKLERVQTDLLSTITEEVEYNADTFLESEFSLNEFVDRFGMKFMHLNTLLQVLSQLGNAPDIQIQQPTEPRKNVNSK